MSSQNFGFSTRSVRRGDAWALSLLQQLKQQQYKLAVGARMVDMPHA